MTTDQSNQGNQGESAIITAAMELDYALAEYRRYQGYGLAAQRRGDFDMLSQWTKHADAVWTMNVERLNTQLARLASDKRASDYDDWLASNGGLATNNVD